MAPNHTFHLPENGLTTAEAVTLAQQLVNREKTKTQLKEEKKKEREQPDSAIFVCTNRVLSRYIAAVVLTASQGGCLRI